MDLWNKTDTKPPPINTYKASKGILDLNKLTDVLSEATTTISCQNELSIEVEYLSRIIYRMSKKFRSDIGFRETRKTYVALSKYLSTDFHTDIAQFHKCILSHQETQQTYLPTKQMLQNVLVRLLTFVKLLSRIIKSCQRAAYFYKERTHRGQSWNVSLLALAIHSKIWSICQNLCIKGILWYTKLLPYVNTLDGVGPEWLPKNYIFPINIKQWLDIDFGIDIAEPTEPYFRTTHTFDITQDDNVEFCFAYDNDCHIINTVRPKKHSSISMNKEMLSEENKQNMKSIIYDIGESVSRSNITVQSKECKSSHTNNQRKIERKELMIKKHVYKVNNIQNAKDLISLIEHEDVYRTTDAKKSISANLGIMQWHAFKKRMQIFVKKLNIKHKKNLNNKQLLDKIRKEWDSIIK